MSKNAKRYFVSSMITFFSGFVFVLVNSIDSVTLETLRDGSLVGVLLAAVRAGIKALLEAYLDWASRNQR